MKKRTILLIFILLLSIIAAGCIVINEPVKDTIKDDVEEIEDKIEEKVELNLSDRTVISEDIIKDLYGNDEDMLSLINQFVGKKAPNFTMTSLDGEDINLSDFKGENVILEFMGTWCPVCKKAIPHIEKYNADYEGAKIISVSLNEEINVIRDYTKENEIENTDYYIGGEEVNDLYNIKFVPIFFFIDSEGIVQLIMPGNVPYESLTTYSDIVFLKD